MLQNGAKKVYSIDVGYGQLAWKLRNDERVVNLERTNMRKVTREQVPDEIDFFSVDVSFISLRLILPVARQLMAENAQAVCLIKPQFVGIVLLQAGGQPQHLLGYNADGKRISKTVNGTTYNYSYLGDQLTEMTWGSNKLHFIRPCASSRPAARRRPHCVQTAKRSPVSDGTAFWPVWVYICFRKSRRLKTSSSV